MVGTTVSHYRIEGVLGAGGMGSVYAATDETLGRRVALKAIRAERRLSSGARARFLREARILSQLDHQHICRVYDYVSDGDADFIVLERVDGRTLREGMASLVSRAERLRVSQEIASALDLAHSHGIVHRDLKPENVMLTPAGGVKVLDFGLAASGVHLASEADLAADVAALRRGPVSPDADTIAPELQQAPGRAPLVDGGRLTMAGQVLGTLSYMSPEQARGEMATPTSDMYALGLMLHELFTGSPAYPAQLDWLDLTRRVRRGETLPATTFDAHLTSLIERLKDPDASRRPASKETLSRLRWIQEKPRRTRRRALGAAAVAAMIVFAVKYAVDLRYERSAAVAAREEADRRRDQAEDLISFMLGDLRARLEPVGRLDVLDEVGARATRYFAAVPEAALTAEELYRRSQALRQIGEVRISQGNMPAATEAFAQSLRLAEDLARRDPANGQWQVGLAASYFFVGVVPFYGRDYLAARGPWEKYLEVASRLVERDPNKSEYLMELAYAHSNLHSIDDALGNYDAALVSGRKSVEIKERLLRQDPSNHVTALELARVRSKVGLTLEAKGDIQAAIREFRHFVEAMSALAARDPSDMRLRFELTSSHIFLGNTLLTFGDVRGARAEFEKAMQLSASLRARDPDNVEWQRDEIFVRRGIADVLLAEGDHRAAIRELDIANALPDALLARDKSNNHWKRHVGYSRLKRARALLTAGDVQRAKRDVTDAIGMLQSLLDQLPTDRGGRRQLAEAHVTHAHLLMATGDGDGARRAFQRAADLVATLVATSFAADIGEPYARALIGLKDVTRAQQVFDDLARVGHWNRDLLLIGRAAGLNVALERTANLR